MKGILLLGADQTIEGRARRHKTVLHHGDTPGLPFEKTLIALPGVRVPWELLPAAWGFLDKWDAAVPLWRYDVTAVSVGTAEEREMTQAVIRDIRVLMHSTELLFVRRNEVGQALIDTWLEEMGDGDKRLSFLRAIYRVKPRLCVLPVSWLVQTAVATIAPPRRRPTVKRLVQVELQPGRLVKCYEGHEERVLAHFERQLAYSQEVKAMPVIDSSSWPIRTREDDMKKGPLIKVEIYPGRYVKMYQADAEAQGLLKPSEKAKPATGNKTLPPTGNKTLPPTADKTAPAGKTAETDAPAHADPAPVDDFTTIQGIGLASARALVARDITTFEQLRQAGQLEFLSPSARQAIEKWRQDG